MLRGFQPCKRRRYCVITLSLIQVQPVLPERRDGGHTDPAREHKATRSDRLQGERAMFVSSDARTQKAPSDGSTHWSTRKLDKALGIADMMARIWSGVVRPVAPHSFITLTAGTRPSKSREAGFHSNVVKP